MQARVIAAANKLGYVPNSAAKSLKTNSSHTIGIVLSDISNPDYIFITRTIEDIVACEDYSLILCSTGDQSKRELNYLQMLLSKNVDGLILNTTGLNNDFVVKLSAKMPMLLLNRNILNDSFRGDFITTDSYKGIYQLTKQLLAMGHRRIYVIQGPSQLTNNAERFRAFQDAMAENGLSVDESYPYLYSGEFTRETGVKAIRHLSTLVQQPTAVMTLSNVTMLGVLHELINGPFHVRIPEELTLASYDSLPNIELLSIRPITAQFDNSAIGQRCAYSILERIKTPSLQNRTFTFEPTIMPGNALGFPQSDPLPYE